MGLSKSLRWRKWGATKKMERLAKKTKVRTLTIAAMCALGAVVVIGAATVRPQPAHAPQDQQKNAAHDSTVVATAGTNTPLPPTAAEAAAKAKFAPVTITGCLAREDAAYKLKDTAGNAAPRARSWKSGFLKKGSASVELYDTSNRAKLPAHVGERISVTGELVDREMYVRSLQRVSGSCKS